MNTYFLTGTRDEIEAILADGLIDQVRATKSNRAQSGVYIANSPGKPDPEFPDDQLLEIKLPEIIDVSPWELVLPPDRRAHYGEWVVPSSVLNEHAKLRQVPEDEWNQLWAQDKEARVTHAAEVQRQMIALGLLDHVKDAHGRPLYRDGQPVWRMTTKAQAWAQEKPERVVALHQLAKGTRLKPNPEIIRENAAAFERLALQWRDSISGGLAETDLRIAVIFMILDYFDCDNTPDLYFGDLSAAITEKLRLMEIKFGGLKGLPEKKALGPN
jgi:hypothetical protein